MLNTRFKDATETTKIIDNRQPTAISFRQLSELWSSEADVAAADTILPGGKHHSTLFTSAMPLSGNEWATTIRQHNHNNQPLSVLQIHRNLFCLLFDCRVFVSLSSLYCCRLLRIIIVPSSRRVGSKKNLVWYSRRWSVDAMLTIPTNKSI